MEGVNSRFKEAGIESNTYVMDNEASKYLKDALRDADIECQLVTPHNHRNRLSERAIEPFKGYFKAEISSLDPDFPIIE